MSQQLNGPSAEYTNTLKNEIVNKDMQSHQNGNSGTTTPIPSSHPVYPNLPQQRPLARVDSRSSFQYRPPFPNQNPRPAPPRQPPPPGSQQFVQRNPVPGPPPRPQALIQGQPIHQNQPQQVQQPRLTYRPQTPYPRGSVPSQRPPGIYQQRSVPVFGTQRPQFHEEGFIRSQTLDTTEIEHNKRDDETKYTNDYYKAPSIAAMNNRSYSLSSNAPELQETKAEARRKSVSSVDSIGEVRSNSQQGSLEGLDKKSEEIPSRPESRAMSRMNKILEYEDRPHSSLTDISQKDGISKYAGRNVQERNSLEDISCKPTDSGSKTQEVKSEKVYQEEGPSYASESSNVHEVLPSEQRSYINASKVPIERNEPDQRRFLDLGKPPKPKSPARSEGDNDSGVDESTQGNDPASNSENRSPRKSSKSRTSTSTPVTRSLSRGSKSPSLKSPDSNATTPGSITDKKKVPMNKIQVGAAPSPNLKVVKSKIGSLENTSYKPGGGKVKIENRKIEFKSVTPRIEAKNDRYIPKGGEKKIVQQKLQWNAKSKIGSLENTAHKPKGGDKKIESIKLDFKEKAKPKVGSKDNLKYQPGGGDVKPEDIVEDKDIGNEKPKSATNIAKEIETKKIELNVTSKIGSLDNMKHRPGGGDKRIFDDKDYLKQKSSVSSIDHSLSGSQNSIPSQPDAKAPVADENLNRH